MIPDMLKFFHNIHRNSWKITVLTTVLWLMHILWCRSLQDWLEMLFNRQLDCQYNIHDHIICKPKCLNGTFSLYGMDSCQTMLSCDDIEFLKMNIDRTISEGRMKNVHIASWNGYELAITEINDKKQMNFIIHYKPILRQTTRSVQIIGKCDNIYVNEYSIIKMSHA